MVYTTHKFRKHSESENLNLEKLCKVFLKRIGWTTRGNINTESAQTYIDALSKSRIQGRCVQAEEDSGHVLHRVATARLVSEC
jgi:hypothetical protein